VGDHHYLVLCTDEASAVLRSGEVAKPDKFRTPKLLNSIWLIKDYSQKLNPQFSNIRY
jgi:hypothetical protein